MAEQWSTAEVADYLGVKPRTVTQYRSRELLPEPDGYLGRTPWWQPDTIKQWHQTRPGRTGRPPKTKTKTNTRGERS